uniref:Uncharacterized protein n=1 Tax=Steinernema glaseri TaxID=37863 RepID=A0A1I7ZC57_9BILA
MENEVSGPSVEKKQKAAKLRDYITTPNYEVTFPNEDDDRKPIPFQLSSHPQSEEDVRQSTPENRYYSKEELEWKKQARKDEINKRKCCCAVL